MKNIYQPLGNLVTRQLRFAHQAKRIVDLDFSHAGYTLRKVSESPIRIKGTIEAILHSVRRYEYIKNK